MIATSYSVDNDKRFARALKRAAKVTNDLTIPLNLISKDFYQSQKAIFKLKSEGQYPDLAESTKKQKIKKYGNPYPILQAEGRLAKSLLDPKSSEAINDILGKNSLVIGTLVPYFKFHQSDEPRKKLPLRKALFIGPEAKRFANNDQIGRLSRWKRILHIYVNKQTAKAFKGAA